MFNPVKFTSYDIWNTEYYIELLNQEFAFRDLKEISNGRIEGIKAVKEHPLIQMVGAVLSSGGESNLVGILPSIGVVEGDADHTIDRVGETTGKYLIWGQPEINQLKTGLENLEESQREGIISKTQIQNLENILAKNNALKVQIVTGFQQETIFISLWCNTLEERQLISKVLRSIIYDLRDQMTKDGIKNINLRTSKGLTNMNFGRVIYGEETELTFFSKFHNYTIIDEPVNTDPYKGRVNPPGGTGKTGYTDTAELNKRTTIWSKGETKTHV